MIVTCTDCPMMQFHKAAAEIKAYARAVLVGCTFGCLVKTLEDVRHQLIGDTDARVAYLCQ